VPTGSIEDQHSDGTYGHAAADGGEMLVHRVNADGRHDDSRAGPALWADGAEYIR
jgi:hypothetical protein